MPLYGYTIADAPQGDNGFVDVFRFAINNPQNVEDVGNIRTGNATGRNPGPGGNGGSVNFSYEDLEGLATVGRQVVGVSESDFAPNGDKGVIVTSVDAPNGGGNRPRVRDITRGASRFGTEAGAAAIGNTLYNIQSDVGEGSAPEGSSLYRLTTNGDRVRSTLIGASPSRGQRRGTQPFNRNFYADSLAAVNGDDLIAGDFTTADGTNNFLYDVDITGARTGILDNQNRIAIRDNVGNDVPNQFKTANDTLRFDLDAGLAAGNGRNGQDLYALLENGTLLTIDLSFSGGSLTSAEVTDYTVISELNDLFNGSDSIDFEGFTIVNEPA